MNSVPSITYFLEGLLFLEGSGGLLGFLRTREKQSAFLHIAKTTENPPKPSRTPNPPAAERAR